MLSLQKEDHGFQTIHHSLDLCSSKSFSNILDSIQSLGQLLQDISLDTIVEADEKAKEMLQRLSSLQKNLSNLNEIKRCLMQVKADSEGGEAQGGLKKETPERLFPNHGTMPPNNLIPFPGPTKSLLEKPSPVTNISPETEPPKATQYAEDPVPEKEQNLTTQPMNCVPIFVPQQDREEKIEPGFSTTDRDIQRCSTEKEEKIPHGTTHSGSVKGKIDFDQRLLKDLIKDYGEFITYANIDTDDKTVPTSDQEIQSFQRPSEPAVRNKTMVQPRQGHYENEGDFDRNLRKLIEDYGQVDIYSNRAGIIKRTVKKAGIAALVLFVTSLASASFFPVHQITGSTLKASLTSTELLLPGSDTTLAVTSGFQLVKTAKWIEPKQSRRQVTLAAKTPAARSGKESSAHKAD